MNEQHDVAMKKVQEVEERLATSDYTNKTYEHILRRYDKERQGMENAYLQMKTSLNRLSKSHAEMEIGIKVKKHEESSLYIRMSGMVMEMEEMRLKRDRMLNQTKNRVSEQAELHKYMSDRDYNRAGIAKEAQVRKVEYPIHCLNMHSIKKIDLILSSQNEFESIGTSLENE